MMCLSLATSEIISIFVRKKNANLITDTTFSQAMTDFRAEVIDPPDFKLVSVADSLIFASHSLIAKHSINATDALVLRSALDAAIILRQTGDNLILIASDLRLLRATVLKGSKLSIPKQIRKRNSRHLFEGPKIQVKMAKELGNP
jgi:hypothetical protein